MANIKGKQITESLLVTNVTGSNVSASASGSFLNVNVTDNIAASNITIASSGSFGTNLGVGTTTPAESLEVIGSISGSQSGSFLNVNVTDNLHVSNDIKLIDDGQVLFGAGNDMSIAHDGTDSSITNSTGDLTISSNTTNKDIILASGSTAFVTIDGSATLTQFNKATRHLDSVISYFGTGLDGRIYHDGSNFYIAQVTTGDLYIQNELNDRDVILRSDDGSGGVTPYITLDGSEKRTHLNEQVRVADAKQFAVGTGDDLSLIHDGTDSYIVNATGNLNVSQSASDKDIKIGVNDGGTLINAITIDASHVGHVRLPNDGQVLSVGAGDDFLFQHDGTDTFIDNNTGNLSITINGNDKDLILLSDNGSGGTTAYLTLDGSEKTLEAAVPTNFAATSSHASIKLNHAGHLSGSLGVIKGFALADITTITNVDITTTDTGSFAHVAVSGEGGQLSGSQSTLIGFASSDITSGSFAHVAITGEAGQLSGSQSTLIGFANSTITSGSFSTNLGVGTALPKEAVEVIGSISGSQSGSFLNLDIIDSAIFGAEVTAAGTGSFTGGVNLADSQHLNIGTGNDLKVYHDGSNNYIDSLTSNQDLFIRVNDGGSMLSAIQIDSSDVGNVYLKNDNQKLLLGAAGDLLLQHDGSNSIVQNNTGIFYLNNVANTSMVLSTNNTTALEITNGQNAVFAGSGSMKHVAITGEGGQLSGSQSTLIGFKNSTITSGSFSGVLGVGTTLPKEAVEVIGSISGSQSGSFLNATITDNISATNFYGQVGTAAQTGINSILATDLVLGEDAQTKIDFETANEIHFYANNVEQVYLADNIFGPQSDSDVDLGTTGVRFKDAYVDSVTTTGNVAAATITTTGNITAQGDIIAENYIVSSSVTYMTSSAISGSSAFGDTQDDIHQFTGSVFVSGSAFNIDAIGSVSSSASASFLNATITDNLAVTNIAATSASLQGLAMSGNITLADTDTIKMGAGADLQIVHDGSNTDITNATGDLKFTLYTDDGDIRFFNDDGSGGTTEYLRMDGGEKRTHFYEQVRVADAKQVGIGTGDDLALIHDGTDSYIINSTGALNVSQSVSNADIKIGVNDGGTKINAIVIDASEVGSVFMPNDNAVLGLGAGNDLRFWHDGTNSNMYNYVGNLNIGNATDDGDIILYSDDGSGNMTAYLTLDGGLGYTTAQKNIRFDDNAKLQIGAGADLDFNHDGTDSTITNQTGDLTIQANTADADIIFNNDNGSGGNTNYLVLDGGAVTVDVKQDLRLTATKKILLDGGGNTHIVESAADIMDFVVGGDLMLRLDETNNIVSIPQDAATATFKMGLSGDYEQYVSGIDVIVRNKTAGGNIRWLTDDNVENMRFIDTEVTFNDGSADMDFRIESNGEANMFFVNGGDNTVLIGSATSVANTNGTGALQVLGTGGGDTTLTIGRFSANASPPTLAFTKSRNGTIGSNTIVQDGDNLGQIIFSADDGTNYLSNSAKIEVEVDGTPGENDTPGRMVFFTTADGAQGATERMRITQAGLVGIGTNAPAYKLDVAGSARVIGGGEEVFRFQNGSTSNIQSIEMDASRFYIYNRSAAAFNSISVLNDGKVGIGEITPAVELEVIGSISGSQSGSFLNVNVTNNLESTNINATSASLQGLAMSGNLTMGDSDRLNIGADNDLRIYHDGSNGSVENHTGNLFMDNNTNNGEIIFRSDDGAGGLATYFYLAGNSATHDGSATTAMYTIWPDHSRIGMGTGNDFYMEYTSADMVMNNLAGDLYIINGANDKDIKLQCDDGSGGVTDYLTLDGSVGYTQASKNIRFADNAKLQIGAGADLELNHDGTDSTITNQTGDLTIQANTADADIIFSNDDGSGGNDAYLTLDGGNQLINFGKASRHLDSVIAYFGSGLDMKILHDGSNGYVTNVNTGDLYIQNELNDKDVILRSDNGSGGLDAYITLDGSANTVNIAKPTKIQSTTNNQASINYDASTRLQIGVVGSGVATFLTDNSAKCSFTNGIQLPDNATLALGTSPDALIQSNGSNIFIDANIGNLFLRANTDDGSIHFQADDGSGGTAGYMDIDGANEVIDIFKDVYLTATKKLFFDTGGDTFIQESAANILNIYTGNENMLEISAAGSDPRISFFNKDNRDRDFAFCGAGDDFNIYSDASTNRVGMGMNNPAHRLDVTGTAGLSTGTAWTNTSDERIKTNVESIENGLDKILKLRPVSFNYTEDYLKANPELSSSKRYNSFIAQEYEEVFPDAVTSEKELVVDGKVIYDDLKQFTPHDLNMYLVKAIQEMKCEIDELKLKLGENDGN